MVNPNEDELEIEVFRSGDYGARGVYTDDDLARVAGNYNPDLHEAPVTIDHAQDGPAHGWVAGLKVVGDRLVARLGRLSPALVEAVRSGAFRKRSVELFRRFRDTGAPYLKAVSFLGAATPRVSGLADPAFSTDEADIVSFTLETEPVPEAEVDRGAIRKSLEEAGTWNPRWEEEGVFDLFAHLPGDEARNRLVAVLSVPPVPVTPGAREEIMTEATASFSAGLCGVSEPASAEAHLRALGLMAQNPELDYRTALLGATT
ncbi:MAG: hypothetical protein JJU11_11890 [Candidatus Sumerlaeia bacterium]|nr:hypothetical protein [Candidatus Sumerlaeia bacterium]